MNKDVRNCSSERRNPQRSADTRHYLLTTLAGKMRLSTADLRISVMHENEFVGHYTENVRRLSSRLLSKPIVSYFLARRSIFQVRPHGAVQSIRYATKRRYTNGDQGCMICATRFLHSLAHSHRCRKGLVVNSQINGLLRWFNI